MATFLPEGAGRKAGLHPKLLCREEAYNALSPLQTPGLPVANTLKLRAGGGERGKALSSRRPHTGNHSPLCHQHPNST